MSARKFKGTGVALITPFQQNKTIDFKALEKLVDFVIDGGVDYLVALGTTGETPTLNTPEKLDILINIIEKTNKRVPVVCGIGGSNTAEIVKQFEVYPMDKVDAILSVSPSYNKPSQAGIVAHYKEINKHCPVPIILYNVPSRTASNMTAATTLQLANECENIIAMKEASGIMNQCMELVKNRPSHFTLLSGDDNLALPLVACGFDGVISVAANAFPKQIKDMIQSALHHAFSHAQKVQYQLLDGINLLFAEGNPSGVKCAMSEMGLCANELRLPMVPVSAPTHELIKKFLKELEN
jgi:4-hydroxy-tetrahydrodipicolinate synthase